MLSVDPVDDCTFWYTTEYVQTTGSAPWRTRIGSFKLANCGAPAPTATPTNTGVPPTPTNTGVPPTPTNTAVPPTPTNTPAPVTSTGFLAPSANAAVTVSAGDNNGYQGTPANAYLADGLFATDSSSGTNSNTSCTNTGKDKHQFYNYNFSLPGTAVPQGIEVKLVGKVNSASSAPKFCVQLSWNGGVTWTTAKSTTTLSTTNSTYTLGTSADSWGRTWLPTEFGNTTFRVRIIDVASSTARTFSLDAISVQVTYR
jgi:hypothetical protein